LLRAIDDDLGPLGVKTERLHAAADYSLNSANFIALAVTAISNQWFECLYKDASAVLTFAMRLGIPEVQDGGLIGIDKVVAFCNSDSATDCTFKISTDPDKYDATKETEYGVYTQAVADASADTLMNFVTNVRHQSFKGPLLLECTSAVSLAVGATLDVSYFNDNP
jgi:hypothetical protein